MYDRLAAHVIAASPVPLEGRLVLDLGAGTGAASKAIAAAGGRPVAIDQEFDMLAYRSRERAPAVVGDVMALPFRDKSFDSVVACFSLNHVEDPDGAMREIVRVTKPGSPVLAAVFSSGQPAHPAKEIIEDVACRFGYSVPAWYGHFKLVIEPLLGTQASLRSVAAARLHDVRVEERLIDVGIRGAAELVRWRFGMAHLGEFVRGLDPSTRRRLRAAAVAALSPYPQPLRPAVLILSSIT